VLAELGFGETVLSSRQGPRIVPTLVISGVAYLLGQRLGVRAAVLFAQDLALGTLQVDAVHPGDWVRIAELVARYRDFPLGMVDASVVACAERLAISDVATLDRRHFAAVRPAHVRAFTLLPG
jgi:predicted nucleic acid-binding protein